MIRRKALMPILGLLAAFLPRPAVAQPRYRVERVVMLIRHGVRAPLDGEAAAARFAVAPLPQWDTPASILTPHGVAALRLLGGFDRQRLIGQGLLTAGKCPTPGTVAVWTNSVSRTIASGRALAEGLLPGCKVSIDHRPEGRLDPLFDALEAGAVPFDARAAAASINDELDQGRALMRGADRSFATMSRVLGCDHAPTPCDFTAMPSRIEPSADGKGIRLSGATDLTSGTAQVFLLQYAEGFPMAKVGWGRASAADIAAMSLLHARLFDVHARSHYMAPRVGGLIARQIAAALTDAQGPTIKLFVGHDNTIAPVTALLGVHFRLPGYGRDDPPIGGGLVFERVVDRRTGRRFVRLAYHAQTPDQVRMLAPLTSSSPPAFMPLTIPACGMACPLARFDREIARATAVLDMPARP